MRPLLQTAQQPTRQLGLPIRTAAAAAAPRARRRLCTVAYRQYGGKAAAAAPPPLQPAAAEKLPGVEQQGAATVLVPLDFYACLGVTRTAGARAVRDALDKALMKRPEAYYSSDTVALRDLLLRNAAECLLHYDRRREYDAKGANGYVASVSADHLPGALVLLQESGYSQLVLSLGAQWLAHNRQDVRGRDVTAAMALAHHTLAVQGLQQEAGCMLEACRHLESALLLIRQSLMGSEHAAATSDLQRGVMQLLKDYSPDYCLALLALPLEDPQRARGHALLRKLLWELPDELSPLGGADKDDFLAAARPLLTPREHLDLHKAAPKGALGLAQQQVHAEVLVAVAFQHRQPLTLLQAAATFKRLEQAAAQEAPDGVDMCVERACIELLLGKTDQALQQLGLTQQRQQQAGSNPTQQAAQNYVLAHCPESSDLLPGVYALTQCWMQQGILGSFRQQAGAVATEQQQPADVDLAPWFDSLLVRAVILVFAMADGIKRALQAALGMPAAVLASLAWLQQKLAAGKSVAARPASGVQAAAAAVPETGSSSSSAVASTSRSKPAAPPSSNAAEAKSRSQAADRPAAQGRPQAPPQPPASTSKQQQEQQQPGPDALPRPKQQRQQKAPSSRPGTGSKQQVRDAPTSSATAAGGKGVVPALDAARTAPAGAREADREAPSLVARARAAAGKRMDEDEEVPACPSPAVRKRLSQQMSALEAQMWDPAPEPTKPPLLSKAVSALFVAAALLVVVGGCRQRSAASTSSLPAQQGPHSLLVDARG